MKKIDHLTIISLNSIKGVGPKKLQMLIGHVIENDIVIKTWEDLHDFLMTYAPASIKVSEDIAEDAFRNARKIMYESERLGIGIITYFDEEYPEALRQTTTEDGKLDPPMILYYKGNLEALKKPGVAIIGTRNPTVEALTSGKTLSGEIASLGYNIVSGLALGCDSLAHVGALNANGTTTAFLAHGLDAVYPVENTRLAMMIEKNGGLLLSEYPVGTRCNAYRLVARDRLQAGLAKATVVIQTGVKGGTMHAVNSTLAAGKPLLAMRFEEHVMREPNVSGNTYLINKGAIPLNRTTDLKTLFGRIAPVSSVEEERELPKNEQLSLFD